MGKTTTAKALQKLVRQPFLHVQGDAFLDMIAPQMWGDPEGIIFRQFDEVGVPSIEIRMGSTVDSLMEGMRASVAALARAGNNCIVDDVMLSPKDQQSYLEACTGIRLEFVALHAPLAILEQRERERGDRLIGLSRWQYARVHQGIIYNFEIETLAHNTDDIARTIASALDIPIADS